MQSFQNAAGLNGCQDCPCIAGIPAGGPPDECCGKWVGVYDGGNYDPAAFDIDTYELTDPSLDELGNVNGLSQTDSLWARAGKVIPAGTQTLSKGPGCFVDGVSPKYTVRAKGSRIWDADDNQYIDYCLACFPVTLGYGVAEVDDAIRAQLERGITFSMMSPLEVEVSEKLVERIPCAEMIRFAKNGSDVTAASVRLARHVTGRDYVVCVGYHGFHDWYVATTDRNFGVPGAVRELTKTFVYNDIASLDRLFRDHPGEIACVIMEPSMFEFPRNGFLEEVRALVDRHGALLVFDEMLTGFRLADGGAQELFGVTPDLATFGKGVANGMPLGILVGREKYMREFDKVFLSSTYGGEALSLAAASAGLDFYREHDVIRCLWRAGKMLFDNFSKSIGKHSLAESVRVVGYPVRQQMIFTNRSGEPDYLLAALYQQEMFKRGIMCYAGVLSVSWSHSDDDLMYTAKAFDEALEVLSRAVESNDPEQFMEGIAPQPVFRALRDTKQTGN